MEFRQLGKSGLRVSAVGLGALAFGDGADVGETKRLVERAIGLGVNFIDTANIYSRAHHGISEEYLGKALAGRRQEVVIGTKVRHRMGELPNDEGLSRKHIMDAVEGSLRRLGTDYIDLYQMHRPDPSTPMGETLRALDDLVQAGKVRYVGCSNFAAWQVCEALWEAERQGLAPLISVQPRYNIFDRGIERELVPVCRRYGIGIIPYSPLDGGILTGKYTSGALPPAHSRAGRSAGMRALLTDDRLERVERLAGWARERGHTVGELALAWLLAHSEVSTVIAGASSVAQIEANVAAVGWRLTGQDLREIGDGEDGMT